MHHEATAALPAWTVTPFLAYLFLIAATPLVLPHFWEKNRNKLIVALTLSAPVVVFLALFHPGGGEWLLESVREYACFMALLAALFTISGGIYVRGALAGTPGVNTIVLAIGAALASVIGTTGASMLLIRPLLRANRHRTHRVHLVVFFIFIVSNGAGMLTPLGDPPLFLGFLRGVPFFWTLRLLPHWSFVVGALLALAYLFDRRAARREPPAVRETASRDEGALRIEGSLNFVWLLGVVTVAYVMGAHGAQIARDEYLRAAIQVAAMVGLLALSMRTTAASIHKANAFGWAPIIEVGVVFVGVFLTMVPALRFLGTHSEALGITKSWQFFWGSGILSSVLDNAPTYLTFASLAVGVVNQATGGVASLSVTDLGALAAHPLGQSVLTAIACGSVFMGANTYIGNGPNFMVKALAEEHGVRMPGFFGYVVWSACILLPLFGLVTLIFFRA